RSEQQNTDDDLYRYTRLGNDADNGQLITHSGGLLDVRPRAGRRGCLGQKVRQPLGPVSPGIETGYTRTRLDQQVARVGLFPGYPVVTVDSLCEDNGCCALERGLA